MTIFFINFNFSAELKLSVVLNIHIKYRVVSNLKRRTSVECIFTRLVCIYLLVIAESLTEKQKGYRKKLQGNVTCRQGTSVQ